MYKKLFIPGPTHVREEILMAQVAPMIGHRSDEFEALFAKCEAQLKQMFFTENRVYIVASSGSGLQEAAIRNGVAVDCSFGMSPQSGLPHNNRTGDIDVFVMTEGGPDNASSLLLFYIYENAFKYWDTGYGATLTVVLLVLLAIFAIGQFFYFDRKVHYQ